MSQSFGLQTGSTIIQLVNIAILLSWVILGIICLVRLGKMQISSTARAIWALVILIIPLIGAIAFLIVKPGEEIQRL
jgi:hypothetical protein